MLTANEMQVNIGKTGTYSPDGEIFFEVQITDSRNRFGTLDYRIEPVAGAGGKWVPHYKVKDIRA